MCECFYCGDIASTKVGEKLTLKQLADNAAWRASFTGPDGEPVYHTGHCPHLVLPPMRLCQSCLVIHEVMEG